MQFRLTNSQRYLVVGLVGLVLWLVPGLALTKYRCEFVNLNCIFTQSSSIRITSKFILFYLFIFKRILFQLKSAKCHLLL